MNNSNDDYKFNSKKNYSVINKNIVQQEKSKHVSQQNTITYNVEVKYYEYPENYNNNYDDEYYDDEYYDDEYYDDEYNEDDYYDDEYYEEEDGYYDDKGIYYVIIPEEYKEKKEELIKEKNDIFSKGKILTFSTYNDFTFDAVIEYSEEDPNDKNIEYAYLVPVIEDYRYYSPDILGKFKVEERKGDLTYERMLEAINQFLKGNSCSPHLEKYILGNKIKNGYREFKNIFNYSRYYLSNIYNYAKLTKKQKNEIDKIFYQEMSTINITKNYGNKIISLIIYAIYQTRNNIRDKILICSASNSVADSISLELLRMKEHINKLNILRIYAKNQEIIERNKRLDEISFHKLIKRRYRRKFRNRYEKRKWIIKRNDVIISTCVNSYNDDIINFKFPFVIIIDANNSNENENLIPITLNAKHVLLISYEGSDSGKVNLYKRMKNLYPENHCEI